MMDIGSDSQCPLEGRSSDGNASDIDGGPIAFICFPKLPTKVWLKVWKEACFQWRIIDVWPCQITSIQMYKNSKFCYLLYYISYFIVLAILYTF